MSQFNRREFMTLSATAGALAATMGAMAPARAADSSGLIACMHGITSSEFDFRTAMEGWARAGIKAVEPDLPKARQWEEANGKGSARKVLDDLGLTAYSSTNQLSLEETSEQRTRAIEDLKWKVEMAESLGADRMVIPSAANQQHSLADYDQVYENLREAAEIAKPHNVALMVEFTRASRLIGNVRTSLNVVRAVNHPNLKFMIDLYHFWAGTSKFEDLDLINPGEIHHVHFQDTPAMPPFEVAEQKDRAYPGEGIAPLQRILDKLVEKGYNRALSMELFDMEVRRTDPFEVASKALATITPYIEAVRRA
ncbi:MAG: sugar phosphate isomerase/epimerase [Pseudomonadales bacterium]|nr:sugar phosphate isomerase/epimerase [Pseudomonadales bacterium]